MKIANPLIELCDAITDDDNREAARVKPISMLSVEALAAMRRVVMRTSGPVIEVGTYIGGTSILLARAIADRRDGRLICVEAGGEHPTHPQLPSLDILADWRTNLLAEVLYRKKMGLGCPVGDWLRQELREMAHDVLLSSAASARGIFQKAYVERLLAEHVSNRVQHDTRLWALL